MDEEEQKSEIRTQNLELYERQFMDCLNKKFANDFWIALHNTINRFNLTPNYFFDLLSAFKQDAVKSRYQTYNELFDYCSRSANPVGRIILEFFNIRDNESIRYSDAVCTALQLTNFYQDILIDIQKNRIYIPLDEVKKFGVELNQFELKQNNTNFEQLLKYQIERTKLLFIEGRKLISILPGNLNRQIMMTILGGEKILKKIEKINFNVVHIKPKLSKLDYIKIFAKSIFV